MDTRTYDDLILLIQGLCGVDFATIELPRIKALINRRATRAYRATNYWPRFLAVGESRVVTSDILPWEETDLATIGTYLRIHVTAPYSSASAQEYHFHIVAAGAKLICGDSAPTVAYVTYKATHTDVYGSTGTDVTDVPKEWFEYLAHGTYADFLRGEGQQEKAIIADNEASDILTDELLRVDQGLSMTSISTRILTNSNMQTR